MQNQINGQNKDGFIDIMIDVNKPIFTAGQFVDGAVHVNCKAFRNYHSLKVKLQVQQHNSWKKKSISRRYRKPVQFKNTKQTYLSSFDLVIFANGIINEGQYTFPFKFLLSKQFSGSFLSTQSHIRYLLSAELIPLDNINTIQSFTTFLNILEPSRISSGLRKIEEITNQESGCCCFKSIGPVKMSLTADRSFVQPGDTVNITGQIDNRNGKKTVSSIKVHFLQKLWRISNGSVSRTDIILNHILYSHKNSVQVGKHQIFNCSVVIPSGLIYSTAIGSIVSQYYTLSIMADMGGQINPLVVNQSKCDLLLIYHTNTQKLQTPPKIQLPTFWTPMIASQVICTNMAPYIYQPNAKIPFINRCNTANLNNFNQAMQTNPMNYKSNKMAKMSQMNQMGQQGLMNHMNQMNNNNINATQQNLFDNQRNNTEYLANY